MIGKVITSVTRIETNKQGIVSCLVSDRKVIIFSVFISTGRCVDFHSQLTRDLRQLMNLFVSKPKLSSDVTKAVLVLVPAPVESNKPIEAFVKDGPSAAIRLHVTVHFKTSFVCWVYCVHSAFLEAGGEKLCAISGWKNKINSIKIENTFQARHIGNRMKRVFWSSGCSSEVEHPTGNRKVTGSNPHGGLRCFRCPKLVTDELNEWIFLQYLAGTAKAFIKVLLLIYIKILANRGPPKRKKYLFLI